jgi:hypothetical protein
LRGRTELRIVPRDDSSAGRRRAGDARHDNNCLHFVYHYLAATSRSMRQGASIGTKCLRKTGIPGAVPLFRLVRYNLLQPWRQKRLHRRQLRGDVGATPIWN